MPGDPVACARCGASLANDLLPLASDEAGGRFTPAYGVASGGAPRGWLVAVVVAVVVAVLVGGHRARTAASPATPTTILAPWPDPATMIIHHPDAIRRVPTTSTTLDFLSDVSTGTNLAIYGTFTRAGLTYARITVLDLDSNRLVSAPLPGYLPTSLRGPGPRDVPTATFLGHHLIVSAGDFVFAESDTLSGPVTDLGFGSSLLAPLGPTYVWIVETNRGSATVREVDGSGRTIISSAPPANWSPSAATAAGIILVRVDDGRHQPAFEVWDPVTGKIRFASGPGATVIAASAHRVAWWYDCTQRPCVAHLLDLTTGRDRPIVMAGSAQPWSGAAAMSPDGRYLALFNANSAANGGIGVLVQDLDLGTSHVLDPGPAQFNGPWSLLWSSSSQWLFLASGTDLVGYRTGDPIGFRHINVPSGLLLAASVIAS